MSPDMRIPAERIRLAGNKSANLIPCRPVARCFGTIASETRLRGGHSHSAASGASGVSGAAAPASSCALAFGLRFGAGLDSASVPVSAAGFCARGLRGARGLALRGFGFDLNLHVAPAGAVVAARFRTRGLDRGSSLVSRY